jgi:hypothetical protein
MNISTEEEQVILERIVCDFGNGILTRTGYLFDQIKGYLGRRVRLSEALQQITVEEVSNRSPVQNWGSCGKLHLLACRHGGAELRRMSQDAQADRGA